MIDALRTSDDPGIAGPLAPRVIEELERILSHLDTSRTVEGLAQRVAEMALINTAGPRPERGLFLHTAAVALWGAMQCEKRAARADAGFRAEARAATERAAE